jgi:hypothetical protein
MSPLIASDDAADHERQRHADGALCRKKALDYRTQLGWSVLALCPPDHAGVGLVCRGHGKKCKSPGKRPWHTWDEFQDRLPTVEEILDWWRQLPTSNLGLALGPVSGVVRLDVEGEAASRQLEEISGGDLPVTPEFRSGRADGTGRGILWAIPPGVVFRTTPIAFQDGELRFQAKGAQTALPPSRHKDGGLYEWLPGRSPDDVPLAPAPEWAVRRWSAGAEGQRRPRPKASPTTTSSANPNDVALALAALRHLDPERARSYDGWLKTGMALHSVSDDEVMLNAWDAWSKLGEEKYEPGVCAAKWDTFSADGGLRLCDLLRWAHRDTGWRPKQTTKRRRHKRTILHFRVEVA